MAIPPDNVVVWAIKSINGEITPNMRMIVFGYEPSRVTFRFYMSETPTEDETEIGEIIATNFDSRYPGKIETVDLEFVETNEPLGKLEPLDFCLYCRHEAP